MKKLRVLALVQVIALSTCLLASCSGGQQTPNTTSTTAAPSETTKATSSAKTNIFGWEVPGKTIEITAFNGGGDYAPTEEQKIGRKNMEKYILDNFNVKLTMQTTDGDGTEAVNLALASNSYPDIIFGVDYNTVLKFKQQNKAQDLTPYMDTIGTNIKKKCGDIYPLLLDDDKKLYCVPIGVNALMELPDVSANIRYDEWLQIGSPKIETPNDYYNALKSILKVNPKTPNGETRYAMSIYNDQDYPVEFGGFWGLKSGWKIGSDNSFTYWTNTNEGKAMTKWFNQIYRDGLFDPDAFNNKFDDWKAKFSNEKIVGAIGGWWMVYNAGHEVWQTLDKNLPENKRYIQVGFKAPEAEAAYLSGKTRYGGAYTFITDKAKDAESIMKLLDFQATEVGLALFNWGIPNGVTSTKDPTKTIREWNIDENGKWAYDEDAKKQFMTETWDYNQENLLGTSIYTFFSTLERWSNGEYQVWGNGMWFSENKWKTLMINNLKGTIYDATPMVLRNMDADTVLAEEAIKDNWTQYWPAVVQSKNDSEFDANWSALQKAITGAGIEGYTKTIEDNYKKNMAKLGK